MIVEQGTVTSVDQGIVASPQINDAGKPTRRAIPDPERAARVVQQLVEANRRNHIIAARILGKLNAERPWDHHKLEEEGLSWKHNFSTKPMSAVIDRVSPRLAETIQNVKYLTNAALPPEYPNAREKTEKFRDGFTRLVRARKEWQGVLESLSLDDVLFGYTVAGCLDENSWFPEQFPFDHVFLADGTKQEPNLAQIVCVREDYLPHELFELISDRKAAESAGWDVPATILAINEASPQNVRSALVGAGTIEIWYQNAERELTLGASYVTGASTVVIYSLLVREVTGRVSHYRVFLPQFQLCFSRDDRFGSMDEVFAFFSFQVGNRTMRGSKGIGRDIYDLAAAQDRSRNEIFDRLWLSGKQFIQGDPKRLHTFSMSVVGSMCIIPEGWDVLDRKIDGNVEPFIKLDSFVQQLMDQLVGAVSPRFLQGERVTAAQVNLFAAREEEGRDSRVGRFLSQVASLVQTMQQRACRSQVIEPDAQKFRQDMLQDMTEEELHLLAQQPVAGTVQDLTPVERQLVVQLAAEKRGHPLYNQRRLEHADVSARIGPDFADEMLLPDPDPTETAEQQRQQQLEMLLLFSGEPVPVSPRDNHEIHLQVLLPLMQQMGQSLSQPQANTQTFEACLAHASEHYQQAIQGGGKGEKQKLAPVLDFINRAQQTLGKVKELDAQHAQLQQAASQLSAGTPTEGAAPGSPPVPPGTQVPVVASRMAVRPPGL